MSESSEWTKARVYREVIQPRDRLNVSYALRLLHAADCLVAGNRQHDSAHDFKMLRDMAIKLKISPTSLLSQKQTDLACELIMRRHLNESLAVIFRAMVNHGDEILLDDADPKWLPALRVEPSFREQERLATERQAVEEAKRAPEPKSAAAETPSPSASLSPVWGLF